MALILDGTNGLSDVDGSAATPAIRGSDANTGVFFGSDVVGLSTGGSERVRVDASGNVGIGTSSPANSAGQTNLEVVGSTARGNLTLRTAQADGAGVAVGAVAFNGGASTSGGGDVRTALILSSTEGATANNRGGILSFNTKSNNGDLSERMRIDSAGNVGIGTSSPTDRLTVTGGDARVNGPNNVFLKLSGAAINEKHIDFYHDNTLAFENFLNGDNNFIWRTRVGGLQERMRIDSSGQLLVGRTAGGNIGDSLGAMVAPSGFIYLERSGASCAFLRRSNNGSIIDFFHGTNTAVGNISVTGSATSYNTSSDYRLKHDIQPMQNALATVALLKPVTYKWNADDSQSQGFIAHELQSVVPECVTGEKDAVDKDGNPQYQGIDTSFLVATLTAAIQEQQAIINDLKARLDAANL
jgi:hypothetical protein